MTFERAFFYDKIPQLSAQTFKPILLIPNLYLLSGAEIPNKLISGAEIKS